MNTDIGNWGQWSQYSV